MENDAISRSALMDQLQDYLAQETVSSNYCISDVGVGIEIALNTVKGAPALNADGNTSDGYHTFNELYDHRAKLFSVIVRNYPDLCWKSKQHHDGTMYDGMFIVGINTPQGQASYHYDIDPYWDMFNCREMERAPEWDGHTPEEAINRIAALDASVVHARWIEDGYRGIPCVCSHCGEEAHYTSTFREQFDYDWEENLVPCGYEEIKEYIRSNCCPNCGARMDGEANG